MIKLILTCILQVWWSCIVLNRRINSYKDHRLLMIVKLRKKSLSRILIQILENWWLEEIGLLSVREINKEKDLIQVEVLYLVQLKVQWDVEDSDD